MTHTTVRVSEATRDLLRRLAAREGTPMQKVERRSAILCEAIRSISKGRLVGRWGTVRTRTMSLVEDILRIPLRL